jgi:hypothetical protein
MAKNIGTLISSAIRPNDSLDPIASAFGNEIKGGLHCYQSIAQRNAIITARMELGMLVSVTAENKIYKLTSIVPVTWVEYGTGVGSSSEWQNSVKTINSTNEPNSPISGDRYLIGATSWWTANVNNIVEFDGYNWNFVSPTNGMSVRVDDENGITYKYNGTSWVKERNSQVYSIDAIGDGVNYTSTISDFLYTSYQNDVIFLSKFNVTSTDSATININGLGVKNIIKPTVYGLTSSITNDILAGTIYRLTYDGVNFQLARPYSDEFNNKYKIEIGEYIVVPPNTQYWLYGDINIEGTLINYGRVVIANGNILSGSIENLGEGSIDLITTGGSGTWSAVGIQGPTGPAGGTSGSSGFSGSSGSSGFNGTSGSSGRTGTSGINGLDGTFFGSSGSSGSAGSSGIDGVIGSNYISTTKIGIDALISSNGLEAGTLYKISGVHPTLYDDGTTSGTTIYLNALTTNKLSKEGHGEFWNPIYDNTLVDFNIYQNYGSWLETPGTGTFYQFEDVVANNGATGYRLSENKFVSTSGNWLTATSIIGQWDGATATITSVSLPTASINDKVIWGGYSWTNNSGNYGFASNVFTLSVDWTKNIYNLTDYVKSFDIIEYDYSNDWISRRYDPVSGNDVVYTKGDSVILNKIGSSISTFRFGQPLDVVNNVGVYINKCYNSYVETINFTGSKFYSNEISGLSVFESNIIIGTTSIYNNIISASSEVSFNWMDINSTINNNNIVNNAKVWYNLISDSYIYNSRIERGSSIENNSMKTNTYITHNILDNQSKIINMNTSTGTNITNSSLSTYSIIELITMNNSSITGIVMYASKVRNGNLITQTLFTKISMSNSIFNLSGIAVNKIIQSINFEDVSAAVNLSSATLIYGNYPKTIYKRPDQVPKLRYYNNSDIMVISDITD